MTTPRTDVIDLGDRRVGFLEWGPSHGPLVLALHGYPDTAWTWRRVAPILAGAGYRVVAPFNRGYAPSDLAPDGCYQAGALARDAEDIADVLANGQSALLGHDWGAITAYAVGSHRAALFHRIVTIAVPPPRAVRSALTPWSTPSAIPTMLAQLRCSWYVGFQQLPWISERAFERVVARLWSDWSPDYDAAEDLRLLREALPPGPRRTAALRSYRSLLQPWHRRRAYAEQQQHIAGTPSVPVLYLHGERDGCLLPALARNANDVLGPGSRVELIAGAGHFVQLEQPARTAALITSFLDPREP